MLMVRKLRLVFEQNILKKDRLLRIGRILRPVPKELKVFQVYVGPELLATTWRHILGSSRGCVVIGIIVNFV